MDRRTLNFAAVLLALFVAGGGQAKHYQLRAQQEESGSPRRQSQLTILQINDVYSTVPINGIGGLARVATLKKQLSAEGHPVVLALAGDFLSPSVASSVFKGE